MSEEQEEKGKLLTFKGGEQVKIGIINFTNGTNSFEIGIKIISQNQSELCHHTEIFGRTSKSPRSADGYMTSFTIHPTDVAKTPDNTIYA